MTLLNSEYYQAQETSGRGEIKGSNKTKQLSQVLVLDGVAGAVVVLPVREGGAGPGPGHQGAAPPPAQGDGAVQKAGGGLHPPPGRVWHGEDRWGQGDRRGQRICTAGFSRENRRKNDLELRSPFG